MRAVRAFMTLAGFILFYFYFILFYFIAGLVSCAINVLFSELTGD